MKKQLLLTTALFAQCTIYALAELNPAAPALLSQGVFRNDCNDNFGVKFGYVGNFVTADRLKTVTTGAVRTTGYTTNSGILTLNFWKRIDLYGSVGVFSYDSNNAIPDVGDVILHSATRTHWGVGLKAVLWEANWAHYGTTYIGANVQYGAAVRTPVDSATLNGATATHTLSYTDHSSQYSLGLSHKISCLVPYLGVYWANERGIANGALDGVVSSSNKTRDHFGWFFGTTLLDTGRMSVTAEARFLSETALSVGADIRF
ncbi:MAG: hypothetical protein P4L16_04990 [Chlamydiales bacterium]|nr:hypothetical protein [Chlamydiales bacterium]